MRSTGKFLGVTSEGKVENKPAGAFIRKKSRTTTTRQGAGLIGANSMNKNYDAIKAHYAAPTARIWRR